MGIPGLWKLVEPVAERKSFQRFCIEEGFVRNESMNGRGLKGLRIGIDALGWVYHAAAFTRNAELAMLYRKCCRLLTLPVNPLFVFGHPDRPMKLSQGDSSQIVQAFKHMLDCLGFAWEDAPDEAEPELASLSMRGFLDVILAEDSDILAFGGMTIIRSADGEPDMTEQVMVYRTEDIENHPDLLLTRADLVLIALLNGIKGCGIATAVGLARAGYGHDLARIVRRHSGAALRMCLATWRTALCQEAVTNSSTLLPKKCPALARNMQPDFPSTSALLTYFQPSVSIDVPPCLYGKLPLPSTLASFAKEHFLWGRDVFSVLNCFSNAVFPGLALRALMTIARARDLGVYCPPGPTFVGEDLVTSQPSSLQPCEDLPESYMQLNIPRQMIYEIASAIDSDIDEAKLNSWSLRELPKLRVWAPIAVKEAIVGRLG